jgi:signal transduction histidine kinase
MLKAADATKRAIAEELHGSVQTKLYAVWVRLTDLQNRVPETATAARQELAKVTAEVDRIREEDIRGLSHRLHPSIVRVSASAALRSLCNFHSSMGRVELSVGRELQELEPAGASALPEHVRLGVYRIAELALGNVARHAQATECRVSFDHDPVAGLIVLTVSDNGQGFESAVQPPGSGGLGFITMRDYADALGGTVTVESRHGAGTVVRFTLPFTPARGGDVQPRRAAPPLGAVQAPSAAETG